jgi:tetratricopeptide (TPR) repeat protein
VSDKSLEFDYGDAFSKYYQNFLSETYNEWGKENHVSTIARFNIIAESEYSDFDGAIKLTNNREVAADISRRLGLIFTNLGILSKAFEYHSRSLRIDEELNDRVGMAKDYRNIGYILGYIGKRQEALESHNNSLKIDEELNDRVGMAADYRNMGIMLRSLGKYQEALDNLNKAVKIYEELNDRVGMANIYHNMSFVLSKTSKDEALESLSDALTTLQQFEREWLSSSLYGEG